MPRPMRGLLLVRPTTLAPSAVMRKAVQRHTPITRQRLTPALVVELLMLVIPPAPLQATSLVQDLSVLLVAVQLPPVE